MLIHQKVKEDFYHYSSKRFSFRYAYDVAIDDKVLVYGKGIASPENVINIDLSDINMQGNCQFKNNTSSYLKKLFVDRVEE